MVGVGQDRFHTLFDISQAVESGEGRWAHTTDVYSKLCTNHIFLDAKLQLNESSTCIQRLELRHHMCRAVALGYTCLIGDLVVHLELLGAILARVHGSGRPTRFPMHTASTVEATLGHPGIVIGLLAAALLRRSSV